MTCFCILSLSLSEFEFVGLVVGAGLAAGVYSGLTYGLKEARGVHDWVPNSCELDKIVG